MSIVQCRYNPNHKMKISRLLIHEDSCPDSKGKLLLSCPYNPVHKLKPGNFENHKKECPQRPKVDEQLEKEMREFMKNQTKTKTNNNTHTSDNHSQSQNQQTLNAVAGSNTHLKETKVSDNTYFTKNQNLQTSINTVGIRSNVILQNEKKERKKEQKKMFDLIEKTDFENSAVFDKNIDDQYNFNEETSNNITMNGEIDASLNLREFEDKYDPNYSDILIDSKNKNILSAKKNNLFDDDDFNINEFSPQYLSKKKKTDYITTKDKDIYNINYKKKNIIEEEEKEII